MFERADSSSMCPREIEKHQVFLISDAVGRSSLNSKDFEPQGILTIRRYISQDMTCRFLISIILTSFLTGKQLPKNSSFFLDCNMSLLVHVLQNSSPLLGGDRHKTPFQDSASVPLLETQSAHTLVLAYQSLQL